MSLLVSSQVCSSRVCLITAIYITFEWFLTSVFTHVNIETASSCERLVAPFKQNTYTSLILLQVSHKTTLYIKDTNNTTSKVSQSEKCWKIKW